ncbi:MAG: hypothetical protein IPM23_19935 [Candidatus Melainabacteria bacterium]|nr:hypothetical protein [Candidatus Melainabacteria bacterium]
MPDKSPLDDIRIAAPCHEDWDMMTGDERTRFCQSCSKNVFNISELSKKDAESLIRSKNGDLCIRLYKRADGTVITDDCPVGLRKLRDRLKLAASLVAGLLAAILSTVPAIGKESCDKDKKPAADQKIRLMGKPAVRTGWNVSQLRISRSYFSGRPDPYIDITKANQLQELENRLTGLTPLGRKAKQAKFGGKSSYSFTLPSSPWHIDERLFVVYDGDITICEGGKSQYYVDSKGAENFIKKLFDLPENQKTGNPESPDFR